MKYEEQFKYETDMRWCIYTEEHTKENDFNPDLDLTAPKGLPDGIYKGEWTWRSWEKTGKPCRLPGITIIDGKFALEQTMKACERIVYGAYMKEINNVDWIPADNEGVHDNFIEGLEWNGEYFKLCMGS